MKRAQVPCQSPDRGHQASRQDWPGRLPPGGLTRPTGNSSQVRRTTARSEAKFTLARTAWAAWSGSRVGTISAALAAEPQ